MLNPLSPLPHPALIILVGPIASGKSTVARRLAQQGAVTITGDAIVNSLHAGRYTLYREELRPLYKAMQHTACTTALEMGLSVVVDKTSITAESRRQWLQIAKAYSTPSFAIKFAVESPETHAKRRYESDPRGYSYEKWLEVARSMAQRWQEPTLEEGFERVIQLAATFPA